MEFKIVASELVLELSARALGGAAFVLTNNTTYVLWNYLAWIVGTISGLEILSRLAGVLGCFGSAKRIPMKGKHLDELGVLDLAFISFSKLTMPVFCFHILQFCWHSGHVVWDPREVTVINCIVAVVLLFVVYDFFYCLFHRCLHHPSVYKYIHKHHHRQMAPTRGNTDAINVHPFEFVCGEYNHLLAIYLVALLIKPHILAVSLFLVTGALLASLNHTRYDISFGWLYSVKAHDTHHWYPDANYSQYTVLWDVILGSFKPYEKK